MRTRFEIITKERLKLDPDRPIVAGVSGGPDSLCLAHLLTNLGYACTWAYFDHQLRPTSAEDGDMVQRMADSAGAAFVRGQGDVPAFARQAGLSIEEAGRSLRYQFLFGQAQALEAQAVAVGHNANDQVETVLMHLLRGAGLDGLSGMALYSLPNPWSEAIPLLRPLLSTWRYEIDAYLHDNGLEPLQDSSNQDTRFYRNRLRHELIPFLETYNPQLQAAILKTTGLLQEDRAVLEEAAARAWQECVPWNAAGFVAFDRARLLEQPVGLQRRLLRMAVQELRPGLRDIDFAAVERGLEFAAAPPESGSSDLIAGLGLTWEEGWIWLGPWGSELPRSNWPKIETGAPIPAPVPGETPLGNGWRLQAEVIEGLPGELYTLARSNRDQRQAWFDAGTLPQPLQIRARQPGDRFQPLGMQGHSLKLSDFFTNLKIPRRAREHWPLVTAGDRLVWAAGLRQGDDFQVTPSTTRAVRLKLQSQEEA